MTQYNAGEVKQYYIGISTVYCAVTHRVSFNRKLKILTVTQYLFNQL